ncbi:MAG: FumA C-terminus/TtdB family hydratase beta subunit [Dictyoglomus sp.]|nr:FumA C-terminus/TtdB family hydratase beta subunit [Dictyoglomus sp.]MCX7941689.1 FumA C-terminus/TtdB family hydratase beta subunit [Dictyoglomaceae bacterium]MDW8188159.1 FumA C-terminus/TtdB family hydratase beta subunit [Dictyoglomus sp.]
MKKIELPLKEEDILNLKVGEWVELNGPCYSARDSAHRRICEALEKGEKLPIDLKGITIYYMGPSPAPPGRIIGSCGPTTSKRMDPFTPKLLSLGVKGFIGKGKRNIEVRDAIKNFKGIYFVTIGGAGAYLSEKIKKIELVAYEDLGPEAIYYLELFHFPVMVAIDSYGRDFFDK